MELTDKEKLFLFEMAFTETDEWQSEYSEKFNAVGISETEIHEMQANRRLRLAYTRLLQRAYRKYDKRLKEIEAIQEKERKFKETVLPILYNNPDPEIYPELAEIRPLVENTLKKYFASEDLWRELDEIYKFMDSQNREVSLIAEGLEDVLHGRLDIRQCVSCEKAFIPTPHGHGQKYCSNACRVREHRKRKG